MHITSGSRLETGQCNKGVYWQVNLDDLIAVNERPAAVLRPPCALRLDPPMGRGSPGHGRTDALAPLTSASECSRQGGTDASAECRVGPV